MTLWVILTIMTSAAAVFLSVPLIRRLEGVRADGSGDVEVYRDQLQEVDRERRDGLIDDTQAETARVEIKRRILAADRAVAAAAPALSGTERSAAIIGATAIVVLGSTILYAVTGSPEVAAVGSQSLATVASSATVAGGTGGGASGGDGSGAAMPPQHPRLEDLMAPDRSGGDDAGAAGGGPALPTVEEMTKRLAARLARNPDDVEGWRTLGWSYVNIGRFDDAVAAYDKAIERAPGNTELRDGRIEALLGGADGVVTTEVQAAIQDTLKRDPKDPRARYYAGLASAQDGDKAAALSAWTDLQKDAAAGVRVEAQLLSEVKRRVSDLRRDMGLPAEEEVAQEAPASAPPPREVPRLSLPQSGQSPRRADKGPDERDVQAAAAMPPADRMTMIRGMVEGLSERLEHSPRDAEGWIKLIRSRMVLGEGDLAKQALAHGLAAFADDAGERDRITAAAQELGVH